ncbi:hypothetical protein GGI03_005469, partial [Coemansia sp. RSA 2337]
MDSETFQRHCDLEFCDTADTDGVVISLIFKTPVVQETIKKRAAKRAATHAANHEAAAAAMTDKAASKVTGYVSMADDNNVATDDEDGIDT